MQTDNSIGIGRMVQYGARREGGGGNDITPRAALCIDYNQETGRPTLLVFGPNGQTEVQRGVGYSDTLTGGAWSLPQQAG